MRKSHAGSRNPELQQTLEASRAKRAESNPEACANALLAFLGPNLTGSRLFLEVLWLSLLLSPRFRGFRRNHLIRLPEHILQFILAEGVQAVEHDPVVAPEVRRRSDVRALSQLGENLGGALESQPHLVETQHGKHFLADFEAQGVAPLQFFRGFGKRETVGTNGFDIHRSSCSIEITFSQIRRESTPLTADGRPRPMAGDE